MDRETIFENTGTSNDKIKSATASFFQRFAPENEKSLQMVHKIFSNQPFSS